MIENFGNISSEDQEKFENIAEKENFKEIFESVLSRYIDKPVEIQAFLELAEREIGRGSDWQEIQDWLEEILPKYVKEKGNVRSIIRRLANELGINQIHINEKFKGERHLKTLKEKDNFEKE